MTAEETLAHTFKISQAPELILNWIWVVSGAQGSRFYLSAFEKNTPISME